MWRRESWHSNARRQENVKRDTWYVPQIKRRSVWQTRFYTKRWFCKGLNEKKILKNTIYQQSRRHLALLRKLQESEILIINYIKNLYGN